MTAQRTILLIDDDPDARNVFGAALQERGYRVLMGVNGAEAVHLARRHNPDLILLDIRMPVMDAWEALRYLRADSRIESTPIWAVSAYVDEETTSVRRETFDRLVTKPIDPKHLADEVDELFGTGGKPLIVL
jgi:CheY-like chemotaxis protein